MRIYVCLAMNKKEIAFIRTVMEHYRVFGRHDLPWRNDQTPYRVLVSELMLQQTQVQRVIPKYQNFLTRFPNVTTLAESSLGVVLAQWQGLGYNRRAKFLHQTAQRVAQDTGGVFPATYEGLLALPGIGPYTAAAVMNFAYNIPVPLIETNVRQVYLHHFFTQQTGVSDADLLPIVTKTMSNDNPRLWCAALMDYGTHLKQVHGNLNTKSKHYAKQTKFVGSDRQIRGAIITLLIKQQKPVTVKQINTLLPISEPARVAQQLQKLILEDLVVQKKNTYTLA